MHLLFKNRGRWMRKRQLCQSQSSKGVWVVTLCTECKRHFAEGVKLGPVCCSLINVMIICIILCKLFDSYRKIAIGKTTWEYHVTRMLIIFPITGHIVVFYSLVERNAIEMVYATFRNEKGISQNSFSS